MHKLQATPVEVLEDMVSDRGSTPLASTTICLKSLIYQAFQRFRSKKMDTIFKKNFKINVLFVFLEKSYGIPPYIAAINFLTPTIFIALLML